MNRPLLSDYDRGQAMVVLELLREERFSKGKKAKNT
jgi:hypothetical protein